MNGNEKNKNVLAVSIIPAIFVLLWSSGFVVAKQGLAHAEPLTFLFWRFLIASAIMLVITRIVKAEWPRSIKEYLHTLAAGILVQLAYFGGCWLAMDSNINAGTLALIVSMQPILAAIIVFPILGEKLGLKQCSGLLLGFIGVGLVIVNKFGFGFGSGLMWCFIALFGITLGTIYQKKYCSNINTYSGLCIQLVASTIIVYPLASIYENGDINWVPDFVFSLVYVSVILSLLTVGLLDVMIKKGEASRVSSLFFLVPPCSALLALIILDEKIATTAVFGMGLTVLGVALVMKKNTAAET